MNPTQLPIEILTDSRQLLDLSNSLSQQQRIAIDTESNSRHRYPERVCLVQLATNTCVYLIDTLSVEDLTPLGNVLADPSITKVIHGADYDIRCLDREWKFQLRNLFDTTVAARFAGIEKYGLSALIEELLGIQIPKDAHLQKSDWSERPLSRKALEYAATDVSYLFGIQGVLNKRLEILGRNTWVSEECARLEEIRYVIPDPETAFLSLKGSAKLDSQQKAMLKQLFLLRESEAYIRNRPPYFVLPHEPLLYLAANPDTDLTQLPVFKGHTNTRFGKLLVKALRNRVEAIPVQSQTHRKSRIMSKAVKTRLEKLKQWRSACGEQLSLEISLVWPRASLERLASDPRSLSSELASPEVRQWQREQLSKSLETTLANLD
jgi:ribonuclease D